MVVTPCLVLSVRETARATAVLRPTGILELANLLVSGLIEFQLCTAFLNRCGIMFPCNGLSETNRLKQCGNCGNRFFLELEADGRNMLQSPAELPLSPAETLRSKD